MGVHVFLFSTMGNTLVCIFVLYHVTLQVTSTPTPALPGQVTRTVMMEKSVLLNPTASLYAPDSSSSVHVVASVGCGGNLSTPNGELTYPNYPPAIQGRAFCTWRVSLEQGTQVSLLLNYLTLDETSGCTKSYLEVWEGSSGSKTLLKKYCGTLEKPERLVSKTNEIEVVFQMNSSSSGRGFLATYSTFTGCNRNFTNNTGLIQSPHYPEDYPHNIQCAYSIRVRTGLQIALALEFLDLAYSAECKEDVLEIWEGEIESSVPIGRHCGYLFSQWVRSKGSELSLRFTSDMANTHRGFNLKYYAIQSDCNSTLNASRGSIASPDKADSSCHWTINSQPGHVISLRFDRFFLKFSDGCARDHLVIRDGESVIGRYCGYQKGEFLYSKTNSITLKYVSTSIADNTGFQIQYEALVIPECGGYLNMSRGSLQSPLFPYNHPSNVRCAWQIEQLPGHVIDLVFDDFELQFSINCTKDYLEVFDGADNTSLSLGRYCGAKKSTDHVTTSGNMMFVEFMADGRLARKGFRVSYNGIKSDCPQNFTNASGSFESPNYPDFYPKNYDCYWLITYDLGYQIYLTLKYFDLDYTPGCIGDYVEISNGTVENTTSRERYCGYLVQRYPIVSSKNELVIKFHSDQEDESRGFMFTYEVDGTGYPPPPRTPTSNELKQTVKLVFFNLTTSQWITNMDIAFKKLIANATTMYCNDNVAKCRLLGKNRQKRSIDNTFTVDHIHLVPGFPTSGRDINNIVVAFYALYPEAVKVEPKWTSTAIPQNALLEAVRSCQDYISTDIGLSIKFIEPYLIQTTPSTPIIAKQNNLLIGLSVAGTLLLLFVVVIISCYCWRKKNHGKFIVKRCVTPIEFVDEKDEMELRKVMGQKVLSPARKRASTLKVVDLDGGIC